MNLTELNREQLEEQADLLGIKVTANTKDATLIKKIELALGETDEEEVELSHPTVKEDSDRITIIVAESRDTKQPAVVGVNGRNYVMQRGKPVSVPKAVVDILNNAVQRVWDDKMASYTDVPRYPYQLVSR